MNQWKTIQVRELGQIITGNTPPRKNPKYYGTHTLFVKPTDVKVDTKYTYISEENYSELGYKKYKNSLIPKGSTCVVTIGSIGKKMTKAHCDLFINQAMNAIVPNEDYDEDFVYYLLKFNLGKLKTLDSGTASGRENVSKSSFSNMYVNVPILKTQKKIAKILSNYDDLIENNLKQIKLLEEKAQLTYEEWFLRFRIDGVKLEIDDESGLPFGWEEKRLKELVNIVDNRGKTPPIETEKTEYPLIEVNALSKTNRLVNYNLVKKYVNQKTFNSWFRNKLKKYDTLISTVGSIAETSMFLLNKGNIAQNIIAIQGENISKLYLYQILTSKKQYIKTLNIGGAQPSIKVPHLLGIKIIVPNIKIQYKFDDIIKPISDNIKILDNQNQNLKEARDILLPRLMTGVIEP